MFHKHLFILSIFLAGCFSYKPSVINKNVAFLYNPVSSVIHPDYIIFHVNDTMSKFFFSIPISELLFTKISDEEKATAKINIKYRLFLYNGNNQMTDSASMTYYIFQNDIMKNFINYLHFKANKSEKYTIEITATDMTRNAKSIQYLTVDKSSPFTRQYFLVTDSDDTPLFSYCFDSITEIYIHHANISSDSLFILYFNEEFPLPAPPFSLKTPRPVNVRPDSIWKIPYSSKSCFRLAQKGMYHIQTDTVTNKGLTLFNFGDNYPLFNTPENLLKPIRYLTQKKEYEKLELFEYKKIGVDNFWLENAGNINRAKELIKVFYNRAMYANIYFTSHTQGWSTDRGMLYIIFGPPNTIYKTNETEQWLYGDNIAIPTMTFLFNKMNEPFSDNNFVLVRNEDFAKSWYQAVDTWRNGRIFSISQ
ncbi:MAG: GWxTD domain-containing protein [Bacteroidia bacterium]|nr:GWxTD domain-containing protein [Bacteroidia bacterium]